MKYDELKKEEWEAWQDIFKEFENLGFTRKELNSEKWSHLFKSIENWGIKNNNLKEYLE